MNMENQKFICENCGSEHDGNYGSGRFCSKKCARSYSTKNESKELKEANCIICGSKIYINKRASIKTCKCEICSQNYHKPSDLKICKICGREYYKQNGCSNQFCKDHQIEQIYTLIKYFGFDKEKLGTKDVEIEFNRIKELLEFLYLDKHLSFNEIGELYNVKYPNNLSKVFKYLNIKRRTRKEITKNAIISGRLLPGSSYKFKTEYHTTWNNKVFYLRSSYESDYAKELDERKIIYEVETLKIKYWDSVKNEYRCSIPDFYIPDKNLIVEIKSSYTLDIQNMKDRIFAYKNLGYNVKVICDHKEIEI